MDLSLGEQKHACATGVDRLYAAGAGLLPLEVREGLFRFGRERLLEASGQSLIKCPARFGSLPGLELRHAQIKERIRVERPFPGALLKQLDGSRIFLLFVTQSSEKLG